MNNQQHHQEEGLISLCRIKCCWQITRNILLTAAVVTVVALFSLPVIFHSLIEYTDFLSQSKLISDLNSSNISESNDSPRICESKLIWSEQQLTNNNTECYDYAGGLCEVIVLEWSYCTTMPSNSSDVVALTNVPIDIQSKTDQNLQDVFSLLASFPECQLEALPFLCQYYFPLVDCSNERLYMASKEECIRLSTTVCSVPWRIALSTSFVENVPHCDSLELSNRQSQLNTSNDTNSNISCRDDFILINGSCFPHCEKFSISPHTHSTLEHASQITAGISGITAFIIVILYSLKMRKWENIQFPTVFTLLLLTDCFFAGCAILLSVIVSEKSFCGSSNLLDTITDKPTPFCIFSGTVFHYTLINMTAWWFIHLSFLVFRVAFPFTAQQMNGSKKLKYIHWISLVIGFFIPLPAILVSLTTDDHRYRVVELPPRTCAPGIQVWYYSIILPTNVFSGIGVCFLLYVIWTLNKMRNDLSRHKRITIGPGERKLILLFVLYLVFGMLTVIQATLTLVNKEKLSLELGKYFQCEATGHIPGKCSRSGFEGIRLSFLIGLLYLVFSLVPFSVLSFVIDWQKCLKVCQRNERLHSRDSKKSFKITLSTQL